MASSGGGNWLLFNNVNPSGTTDIGDIMMCPHGPSLSLLVKQQRPSGMLLKYLSQFFDFIVSHGPQLTCSLRNGQV